MRCLYLTEAQAYFRCPHGVLGEDGADGLPDDSKSTELLSVVPLLFGGRSLSNAKKYDLHSLYASSLLEYTNRYFSFQEDVLNAFYGLQEVFARSFGTSFCCGLPESIFDYALLWRPTSLLQRRGVPLPSWSWASWKGQIQQQWLEEAPQLGGASSITFNSAVQTFRVMAPSEMTNSEQIKSGFIFSRRVRKEEYVDTDCLATIKCISSTAKQEAFYSNFLQRIRQWITSTFHRLRLGFTPYSKSNVLCFQAYTVPFHGNFDLNGGQLFENAMGYGLTLTTANGKRTTRNRRSQQLWTCPRGFHPLQFTKGSTSIARSQYLATVVLRGDHDREPAGVVFDFENDIRHRAKLYESGNNSVRAACYFVFLSSVEIQNRDGSDISNSRLGEFSEGTENS